MSGASYSEEDFDDDIEEDIEIEADTESDDEGRAEICFFLFLFCFFRLTVILSRSVAKFRVAW